MNSLPPFSQKIRMMVCKYYGFCVGKMMSLNTLRNMWDRLSVYSLSTQDRRTASKLSISFKTS